MNSGLPSVAVCLIARNEGRYLPEWLAYNAALGFDEIVVYDNASTDGTAAVLAHAAANDPRIRRVEWPDVRGQAPQLRAYKNALENAKTDWLAFIDIDEFIVLKEHDSIGAFLADFDEDTGAVCINWLVFGSSGHATYTDDLVIRRFTHCAAPDFQANRHVKSIVRPALVDHMVIHAPVLARGFYRAATGGIATLTRHALATPIVHHPAQVNHYVLKSREEFVAKGLRGGAGYAPESPERNRKLTDEFWLHHDRNETVDYAIVPMIPKVEREIARLMADSAEPAIATNAAR